MLGGAPLHLLYVVNVGRYRSAPFQEPGLYDADRRRSYSSVAVGLIAENVELYAASAGLSSWFHNCDRRALKTVLGLRRGQTALYGHTIGRAARSASDAPAGRRARGGSPDRARRPSDSRRVR